MKILILILPLVIIFTVVILAYNAIREYRLSSKRFKKLDEWSDLNTNMVKWGDEITDIDVKQEYLYFCIGKINESIFGNLLDSPQKMDEYINNLKEEIITKYSKYIPSLKQSIREKKINNLLK